MADALPPQQPQRQSFIVHIVASCVVFWLCLPTCTFMLGLVGFIFASKWPKHSGNTPYNRFYQRGQRWKWVTILAGSRGSIWNDVMAMGHGSLMGHVGHGSPVWWVTCVMGHESYPFPSLSAASYVSAGTCIARAEMSICLSVYPSRFGIVTKRTKAASRFVHQEVPSDGQKLN